MKAVVTNRFNLPQEVVNALMKDRYSSEDDEDYDLSVTTLIAPIQQTILLQRHKEDQVVRDVTDYFWSFLGSIAHQVLEEGWHRSLGSVVEKRLYLTVHGMKIGGKFDNWGNRELRDYKSTKVYKVTKGNYSDWEKQLNVYKSFCEKNGMPVDAIKVIALLFDWKENESFKRDYPKAPIVVIDIPVWSEKETDAYIEDRVLKLLNASRIDDKSLALTYPCSREEMWQNLKDCCVMKKGGKRATKICRSIEEAEQYIKDKGLPSSYQPIERYEKRKRCLRYCPVSNHCHQHRTMSIEEGILPPDGELLF